MWLYLLFWEIFCTVCFVALLNSGARMLLWHTTNVVYTGLVEKFKVLPQAVEQQLGWMWVSMYRGIKHTSCLGSLLLLCNFCLVQIAFFCFVLFTHTPVCIPLSNHDN